VCYIEPNNPAEAVKLATVQQGDKVRVHYTGRLDDGEVFDSSEGGTPLAFTVGSGQVIPGFDQGVLGMSPGDAKTVHIPCADAYGEHQSDGIMNVPRDEFPSDMPLEVGTRVQGQQSEGQLVSFGIVSVGDQEVTLDANHPLAGKDLTFDLKLVSIES
jgi:FKBP-type peptidyl-prolyl cis-trans isomerase 2